jgi:hypothetical protein
MTSMTSMTTSSYASQLNRLILILILIPGPGFSLMAQPGNFRLSLNTSGLYSGGKDLPFWFSSNRQGIFEQAHNSWALADLSMIKSYSDSVQSKWDYTLGFRGLEARGTGNYFQPNEWHAGVRYEFMKIQLGAWPETTLYHGLSSTNGDMQWSNNARPMPRIRLSTDGFILLPFVHEWYIRLEYDEGLFNDERYVMNAHLHHKSGYLRKALKKDLLFTIGLEHYAMWGGTSPDLGKLPGFESYLRYVFVFNGTKKFASTDQEHVAGNTLGAYYLRLEKLKPNGKITWFLDHPFDDRVTWQNFRDNLYGMVFESNEKKLLSNWVLELMYTNNQNVIRDENGNSIRLYNENYFRHGIYSSGFSYRYRMISSPFFTPLVIKDGVNLGTGNNRIVLIHAGLEGYFSERIRWKTLLSFSSNKGTFDKIYDQVNPGFFNEWKDQLSGYAEINYHMQQKGWDFAFSLAADKGQMLEDQLGAQLSIRKTVSF